MIRREFVNILLGVLLISSCSQMIRMEEVKEKLEEYTWENKHIEAQEYLDNLIQIKHRWCVSEYDDGRCRYRESGLPKKYERKLQKIIECNKTFVKCSQNKMFKQDAEECAQVLKKQCARKRDGVHYFVNKKSRESLMYESIKEKIPNMLLDIERTENKRLAAAQNKCISNFYWGFHRSKKAYENIPANAVLIKSYIAGNYATESECHEQRLAFPVKYRRVVRNNRCERRYVGEDLYAEIYGLEVMYRSSYLGEGVQKKTVLFKTKKKCAKKERGDFGMVLNPEKRDHEKLIVIKINLKRSGNEINRVVGGCKRNRVLVCSDGDIAVRRLHVLE